ncbi:hypothetical protein KIH74_10475 [Kineosporia sp. J2-2]|uniref:Transposase n=1 Tax=Kineosporia corallincola TaxID=2835133 RepID=A0ABS5TGQ1_9ACTN|nr:hypothetical protein [Kineosporia corallincola]MBT0769346.1 hypothetical protein [Kineosporia corallincola]
MSSSLDGAASELYAVEPGRFTAERTRLAGDARAAGDADAARAIGELRRPTTSAWLVNQLARGEQGSAGEMERLEQLGGQLRQAQAVLDAPRMRELTRQRHQLVTALVGRADEVAAAAGQRVSAAVRRELEDTLGAAVADEQASMAVMSGRLTRALTYAGFGEVDITEATATPLRPRRTTKLADVKLDESGADGPKEAARPARRSSARSLARPAKDQAAQPVRRSAARLVERPSAQPTASSAADHRTQTQADQEQQADEKQRAGQLVEQKRAELTEAEHELRQKRQKHDDARSEQAQLQARLDELQAEVVSVRRRLDTGDRQVAQAERELRRHERHLKDTSKELKRAEATLARLDPA